MEKVCSKCKTEKTTLDFSRDKARRDGLSPQCRVCVAANSRRHYLANREKYLGKHREWQRMNDGGHWAQTKALYAVTKEQYESMLARQDGRCAICKGPPGKRHFHIDHDHDTGKVRGLLCGCCNRGMGYLRDDPALLQAAIEFLTRAA